MIDFNTGSPPPMRGKVGIEGLTPPKTGITPAYAGKSFQFHFVIDNNRDHPRLCGEKNQGRRKRNGFLGSPPPMRGKAFRCICCT